MISILSRVDVVNDLIVHGGNPALTQHSVYVSRDVIIEGGVLSANFPEDHLYVGRSWTNTVGVTAFEEGNGTVYFDYLNEAYTGTLSTETFNIVEVNKYSETQMQLSPGAIMSVSEGLNINYARFALGAGSILKINNSSALNIAANGELYAIGTEASPAKITSDSGYYSFNPVSGAKVAAQYCVFEKMDINGINIASGVPVDPGYFFKNCTFQNGPADGTLLKFYSNQASWVDSAIFPTNTWNGAYNVYHTADAGSITFQNASGGFSGSAYENDPGSRLFWTIYSQNPSLAHSPLPADGATDVATSTVLRWAYTNNPEFTDPIGYIVRAGTDPTMTVYQESYKEGGVGTHLLNPFFTLEEGVTFYWQVIPTTESVGRNAEPVLATRNNSRGATIDCPIWSFSTAGVAFPYSVNFDSGASGWTSGVISGTSQWELGMPAKTKLNTTHSGSNAWVTNLSGNYTNGANIWLQSPELDFRGLQQPSFSAWLNIWSSFAYDGAILESSIDGGNTWQYVSGDLGFYNNTKLTVPYLHPSGAVMVSTRMVSGNNSAPS